MYHRINANIESYLKRSKANIDIEAMEIESLNNWKAFKFFWLPSNNASYESMCLKISYENPMVRSAALFKNVRKGCVVKKESFWYLSVVSIVPHYQIPL